MRIFIFPLLIIYYIITSSVWGNETVLYSTNSPHGTSIYSFDPVTNNIKLLFSDENTAIKIYPPEEPLIITSTKRLFARAIYKDKRSEFIYRFPIVESSKKNKETWFFELSTDGSNKFRKIFCYSHEPSETKVFVNASGTKIGYAFCNSLSHGSMSDTTCEILLSIYDTDSLYLLKNLNFHLPFCRFADIESINWLPDNKSLIFSLAHFKNCERKDFCDKKALFLMNEDGTGLHMISPSILSFPIKKGYDNYLANWHLIGVQPDSKLLFSDRKIKTRFGEGDSFYFFYLLDLKGKIYNEFPVIIMKSDGLGSFFPSPSGKYIAYQKKYYPLRGKNIYSWGIITDLNAGIEKKVYALNNQGNLSESRHIIGWLIMEYLNKIDRQ